MQQRSPRHIGQSSAGNRQLSRRGLILGGGSVVIGGGAAAWVIADRSGQSSPPSPDPTPTSTETSVSTTPAASTPAATPAVTSVSPSASPVPTDVPATPTSLLEESTIADLRDALDRQVITVVELVQAALDRIAAMDGDATATALHAVIETNPDALEIAAAMDEELLGGTTRGPLHGIPVLVKDVFASADRMRTTAGSLALTDNVVVEDAFLVQRLRDAGAVLLGKTNMSEWSAFRSSGLGSGWSARGGQSVNPYMLDKSPWGSSSGSAIAVAASYVPLALGAETDGSILCPAAACGVVGLKPTVGLTSRVGVIPISMTQDSPGPIGRTVRDVAILLSAIAGYDPEDAAYQELATSSPASEFDVLPVPQVGDIDYTVGLDASALDGMRIGIARTFFGWDAEADAMMDAAISTLRAAGAEIIDDVWVETAFSGNDEYVVLITEFGYATDRYFERFTPDGPVFSLADVVMFNDEHAEEELSFGDQILLEQAVDIRGAIDDEWYQSARTSNNLAARGDGIDAAMDQYELDALIAPTAPVPYEISSYGDAGFGGSSAQISAIAGYPALTLPIGLVNGLPVGMNIFGRAFSEQTLLKVAYGFEQILQARTAPLYIPSDPTDDPPPVEEETVTDESATDEPVSDEPPADDPVSDDSDWTPPDESEDEDAG